MGLRVKDKKQVCLPTAAQRWYATFDWIFLRSSTFLDRLPIASFDAEAYRGREWKRL